MSVHEDIKEEQINQTHLVLGINLLLVPCWPVSKIDCNYLDVVLQTLHRRREQKNDLSSFFSSRHKNSLLHEDCFNKTKNSGYGGTL